MEYSRGMLIPRETKDDDIKRAVTAGRTHAGNFLGAPFGHFVSGTDYFGVTQEHIDVAEGW
jgi:hypothetical protein